MKNKDIYKKCVSTRFDRRPTFMRLFGNVCRRELAFCLRPQDARRRHASDLAHSSYVFFLLFSEQSSKNSLEFRDRTRSFRRAALCCLRHNTFVYLRLRERERLKREEFYTAKCTPSATEKSGDPWWSKRHHG